MLTKDYVTNIEIQSEDLKYWVAGFASSKYMKNFSKSSISSLVLREMNLGITQHLKKRQIQ